MTGKGKNVWKFTKRVFPFLYIEFNPYLVYFDEETMTNIKCFVGLALT